MASHGHSPSHSMDYDQQYMQQQQYYNSAGRGIPSWTMQSAAQSPQQYQQYAPHQQYTPQYGGHPSSQQYYAAPPSAAAAAAAGIPGRSPHPVHPHAGHAAPSYGGQPQQHAYYGASDYAPQDRPASQAAPGYTPGGHHPLACSAPPGISQPPHHQAAATPSRPAPTAPSTGHQPAKDSPSQQRYQPDKRVHAPQDRPSRPAPRPVTIATDPPINPLSASVPAERSGTRPVAFGTAMQPKAKVCEGPVFRMPLEVVMRDQGRGYIPYVVEKCLNFLVAHMGMEGLFRVSGAKVEIDTLKTRFDSGEDVTLEAVTMNPHTVAGLLKQFFRELPEPLCTFELFDAFLETQNIANQDDMLRSLRRVCDRMPEASHALMECLLHFLNLVANKQKSTGNPKCMTVANLALVFAPNLLRRKEQDEEDAMRMIAETRSMSTLLETLIEHNRELFGILDLKSLDEVYETKQKLGSGAYASVFLCVHRDTGLEYAVKVIRKSSLEAHDKHRLELETNILRQVRHPHIISLKAVCETTDELYLVMENARGGELFDYIVARGAFTETDAQKAMRQICQAVDYLHDIDIVHRDIKPENILLKEKDKLDLKLADFGLSKIFDNVVQLQTACGSPGYVAPEILQEEPYGKPVDMWSVGVIAYILLSGYPPFASDNISKLFQMIMAADYSMPAEQWDQVSGSAKDFVKRLLMLDPAKRLTAKQALLHPFLAGRSQTHINLHNSAVKRLVRQQSQMVQNEMTQAKESRRSKKKNTPTATGTKHVFKRTTFKKPTWCDHCSAFMW
eukprot:CAMPEP_0174243722 /NCGR_PEP_ID=MMETSP0417-20130205/32598_1 /TAXON_ID=242541 /ORGANISM="Mayorella sp, Strain BSH-02190019" /LENGTH=787 /DNA_ID=CAMNT_0015323291 /DNA_START=166 /DNA_END=2526 /DNA_ORIENTATION=+